MAGTRIDRALMGVQLYVVAAYLSAGIIPYLWSPRPAPPTWMVFAAGWLLGVPGFYITLLGPLLAVPLATAGALTLVLNYRTLPDRLRVWCMVATALATAFAFFSLTPQGQSIATFVAD